MTDKVKRSQLALLLLILVSTGKYLRMPGEMYKTIGRDFWISVLIMFAIDLLSLLCVLWVINRNNGKSLYDIMGGSIGGVAAKIVMFIFAAFFFLRVLDLSLNLLDLLTGTLMIKTNWVAFYVPMIILIAVNLYKGFTTTARLGEILVVFTVLSIVGVYFISSKRADYGNLMPFAEFGIVPILKGITKYNFWFGDYLFILFVMEKIVPKSKDRKKAFTIPASFLAGTLITMGMITLFIAIFGETSWLQNCAMAKISQFSVRETVSGRLDWLDLIIWMAGITMKIVAFSYCAVIALQQSVMPRDAKPKPKIWAFAVFAAGMLLLPLFAFGAEWIAQFFSQSPLRYVFWVVLYAVPLSLPLMYIISRRRANEIE